MSNLDQSSAALLPRKSFSLDRTDRKVMGVCSGIANYFGVDKTLVRVAFAVSAMLGVSSLILVYLAIGLIAD
jgi:phage shock protein PspC (stress-responsive transcriptional regulator)